MFYFLDDWMRLALALAVAFLVAFSFTPIVKVFAQKVGAIDIPTDSRRMHSTPIPRMGGLAIFLGFLISTVLFAEINRPLQGILIGAVIIVASGAVDDITPLRAWTKLGLQVIAAAVAVYHGVVIEIVSDFFEFESHGDFMMLGVLAIPLTVIWIAAVTNSVNLIDGLDGLACGVSTISSVTMLIVALIVSEGNIAIVLAALAGGCVGFIPYNLNPAKIFMGDTGSQLLGFVLATVSVIGMFKFYALFTFAVPLLSLAVPILDTAFAFCRRIAKGQSPFKPDRGHFHHRLMDIGLSQKQAVAVLYAISAAIGLVGVVAAAPGFAKLCLIIVSFALAIIVGLFLAKTKKQHDIMQCDADAGVGAEE